MAATPATTLTMPTTALTSRPAVPQAGAQAVPLAGMPSAAGLVPAQAGPTSVPPAAPITAPILLIGPPPERPMWAHYVTGSGYGLDAMEGALLTSRPMLTVLPAEPETTSTASGSWGVLRPLHVPAMTTADILAALVAHPAIAHPAAVITLNAAYHELAGELAAALGLPGPGAGAAAVLADRTATRDRLQLAGVPVPHLTTATGATAVDLAATEIGASYGYPLMLRSRERTPHSSVLVASRAHITVGLQRLASSSAQVLVEAHEPPIITAICASSAGSHHLIALVRHSLSADPTIGAQVFVVDPGDPLADRPAIAELAQRALTALEVDTGPHHLQIRLPVDAPSSAPVGSPAGLHPEPAARPQVELVVTDVEPGVGSPLIVRLVELACGIDLTRMALELASGADATTATRLARCGDAGRVAAAVCSSAAPPTAETFARLALQPGVDRLIWHHRLDHVPGDDWPIGLPYGYGIVSGTDVAECRERAQLLASQLLVTAGTQA
ncbi:acetyl-CoA carboxylase biotin carboxylase subunit family protein [Nonomuraea sp. NPDC050663]|uniref:acetyl-CoA carboxylase biotin carboxylase subunit family protein n=1 Tax=Nonomuraea sp. NPDC050663 TaxID=3364370 RepID=UPI0037A43149